MRPEPTTGNKTLLNRRSFFGRVGAGLYGASLAHLLTQEWFAQSGLRAANDNIAGFKPGSAHRFDLKPKKTHFDPKAKTVIHLFMNGGPSQMDLFDPKSELDKHHGKSYFDKIAGEVENPGSAGALMRSPFKFRRHGQSGMWVSDVMPQLAKHVDDIALIRSMYANNLTHEPSIYKIQTGRMLPGHPCLGSWLVYGLGSENQNLPAYVVLDDPLGLPINGVENWQAGYLPPLYQGTRFRATGSPVLNLKRENNDPTGIIELERGLLAQLDQIHRRKRPGQSALDARIASYELAARMQLTASDALDLSKESPATHELYGLNEKTTESYGRRCLIARRLVERGVRFVQLYINAQIWDNHTELASGLKSACDRTDKPIAGLLSDLKQRGLWDNTLVVWGGEFGRLPIAQLPGDKDEKKAGRDHNKNAMVTWFAGAGIKPGMVYGTTDELGMAAEENKVSVQDWHATILHLLGLNHEELYYERHGLREKLTSVFETHVVKGILA